MTEYIDVTWKQFSALKSAEGYYCINFSSGVKHWRKNEKLHRIGAPSVIAPNGELGWHILGIGYYSNKGYQNDAGLSDEEMTIMILKYGDVK